MPGPPPKHPGTRARRNRTATAATLRADDSLTAPELPELGTGRPWHDLVLSWWADLWASPMAPEYTESDQHGLFLLAVLHQDFWTATEPKDRQNAAKEIRLQEQRYGLSPIDRRRLQWTIEHAQEATDRGARRRNATPRPPDEGEDPRLTLVQ